MRSDNISEDRRKMSFGPCRLKLTHSLKLQKIRTYLKQKLFELFRVIETKFRVIETFEIQENLVSQIWLNFHFSNLGQVESGCVGNFLHPCVSCSDFARPPITPQVHVMAYYYHMVHCHFQISFSQNTHLHLVIYE